MLLERRECAVCLSPRLQEKYRIRYSDSEIRNYLIDYYDLSILNFNYDEAFKDCEFVVLKCLECNAFTQKYIPDDSLMETVYFHWIDKGRTDISIKDKKYPLDEYTHYLKEGMIITDFQLKRMSKSSPCELKVLDFGAGWGIWANAMKACGCDVFATEISKPRIENLIRNGINVISEDELSDHDFDFINTEQVFEHLREPYVVANKLAGSLNNDGVLKISVPFAPWIEQDGFRIDWSAARYAKHSPMPVAPLEHLNYFTQRTIDVLSENLDLYEVYYPKRVEMNYAFNWNSPRNALKNVALPLFRKRVKNYFLLSK